MIDRKQIWNPDKSRLFYDEFMKSRMLSYRLHGNPRLERAIGRARPLINKRSNILDIGCGIGIVSERLAAVARSGNVVGVDLSEENIWYAKKSINRPNVSLFVGDIIDDFDAFIRKAPGPYDCILLVDVIEHIPEERRGVLLRRLRSVSDTNASVVITYPSPSYQNYLTEHLPDELQVIDNIIPIEVLIQEAGAAGLFLRHYSVEDIWMKNQYVHCVFQYDGSVREFGAKKTGFSTRVMRRVRQIWARAILYPIRKRRYVKRIFGVSGKLR